MAELLFKDPRDYLQFEFELRRARRPAYSMRALARDLAISPSSLNDFMKARVGMSKDRIEKIATALRWSDFRREYFRDLILSKYDKDKGIRQASSMRVRARLKVGSYALSVDAFKAISEWYHLVILELCGLRDDLRASDIARELSISPLQAQQAVKRLLKLGLLRSGQQGLKPSEDTTHFGDESSSEAIVTFHSQILELTQKALHEKPMEERVSHSLIFSVRENEVAQMNNEIRRQVMNVVNRYAQTAGQDAIQVLTLHSFPVWSASAIQVDKMGAK